MPSESRLAQVEELLNRMKEESGIGGGLVRLDGVIVKSTMALPEAVPMLISRTANVSDAIMREAKDAQKEAEITIGTDTLVIVRAGRHFFFGLAKSKDEKKVIIEYAKKIESALE